MKAQIHNIQNPLLAAATVASLATLSLLLFTETAQADNLPPIAACRNVIVEVAGCPAVVDAEVVDAGSQDPDGDPLIMTLSPPGPYDLGRNDVTLTVTDPAGAAASCEAVIEVMDLTPPVIVCPADITVCSDGDQCSAVAYYTVVAVDSCGVQSLDAVPPSGSVFPIGTTTVTCIATDVAGNTATCMFTVTVMDCHPPVIVCPANITVCNDQGQCSAVVNYFVSASDTCSSLTLTALPPSGAAFPVGTTIVECMASDEAGNTATCVFTVTVNDCERPVLTCPADITVGATSPSGAVVTFAPIVTDQCPGTTLTSLPPSGSTFPIGTTIVTCSAKAADGNTNACQFKVTVIAYADLAISKSTALTKVSPGQKITYTITVRNNGVLGADGVVINDPVPANCTFVSATGGGLTAPPVGSVGTVSWAIGSLPSGATATVTVTVKLSNKGKDSVTNTASVTSTTADPNLANNSATVTTRVPAQGKK